MSVSREAARRLADDLALFNTEADCTLTPGLLAELAHWSAELVESLASYRAAGLNDLVAGAMLHAGLTEIHHVPGHIAVGIISRLP